VLAAELLQVLINHAASKNIIQAPIAQPMDDFPIVQFADDTLLFMKADAQQLFFLKALLNCFAQSTSLRVNYQKSQMLPINVSDKKNLETFPHLWLLSWLISIHLPGLANGNHQTKI
jgi:hypothetical protein